MSRLRDFAACTTVMLCCAALGQTAVKAPPAPAKRVVPRKTFTDPANGVSFRYPAVWKFATTSTAFMGSPDILQRGQTGQAVVTFTSAGNFYAKTNLNGLEFTYVALPGTSETACAAAATANASGSVSKPDTVTINGVPFLHVSYGSAGMCHQEGSTVYETYQNGRCYLFEADVHTTCPMVDDGKRALTGAESKALQRHLDAIIQTVRIAPPK